MNSVMLTHPDFNRPFILSTNVSLDGLGTVLSQVVDGDVKTWPSMEEAEQFRRDTVQDALRISASVQSTKHLLNEPPCQCLFTSAKVSAVLESHKDWEIGAENRVVTWISQDTQQLLSPGQSVLPVFSLAELQEKQREDACLSRVLDYVERGRRASRCERAGESNKALRLLKQWERLKILEEVLYCASRDCFTGKKRLQYVVPSSLVSQVVVGVHDEAGHQEQGRTLRLMRQRFFWRNLERNVHEYVKCCKRCVVSKTHEPEGRAPLENVKTSRPLELFCIDFWSAEASNGRTVDVLVVTDHFSKMAHAYPC